MTDAQDPGQASTDEQTGMGVEPGAPEPAEELPPGYPTQWEADVVLRDGSVAHMRPIKPSDIEAIHRFHSGQSEESIYMRFFAPLRRLSDKDVHRFTHVDYVERVALVATLREDIIGIGRYDKVNATSAEVAFNISDHYQGKGIGSVMLEHLAAIAQEMGITQFVAEVLPQNRKMLAVFSEAGYEVKRTIEDGVVSVRFDIHPTEQSQAVRLSREHRAEAKSMQTLLFPTSIAVVGASRREDSIGTTFLANIKAQRFTGRLHAVNPGAEEILGVPCLPMVSDIEGGVDLAVIAVPAERVLAVVDDCANAGVRALVVVSSGFAETGEEGAELQRELVRRARGAGMRIVGPNSFGIINTHDDVRLNASLTPRVPPAGHLGLFVQSGALGVAVLDTAARRNLGVSAVASSGNRVDVSGNDFMQYWIDDERTHAVGLYLESMGNPRKFSRIARNLAGTKPVMVVKSGVTAYGVPPGHTVRPTKARPEVFASMLRQAGVIRVHNVHQMFDVAQLVIHQPLPQGPRVAIVTNSSALGAITADTCVSAGLEVVHGPVDLPSEASAEDFTRALEAAFEDEQVNSVLTCFIPPLVTEDEAVGTAVSQVSSRYEKPCVATFLGMRGIREVTSGDDSKRRAVPLYDMPEDAVHSLRRATQYGQWLAKDKGEVVAPVGINARAAEQLVDSVLKQSPDGRALTPDETAQLLGAYGITLWPAVPVANADEAVAAAEEMGYPVVLKSISPLVRHQSNLSGVRVDLASDEAVREAYAGLNDRLAPLDANRFVVQKMASPGVSCVVESDEDPLFGPVVAFSLAGPLNELLEDIAYRIPPLTDVDVAEMVTSIKSAPLLHGHRGADPVHRAALSDLIARISVLADDRPEIASLTLNPVNATPAGIDVLGADCHVAPAPRRADPGRRSLT